jgi:hypothetical protein
MNKEQKIVLKQVVDLLQENNIVFQISGGLAAIAYGSERPLCDIDIIVDKDDIAKAQKLFKEHIVEDFRKYEDEHMEIWGLSLEINNVDVDITQAQEAYYKNKKGIKTKFGSDLSKVVLMTVEGIQLPIESKEDVIAYKKAMARDVDLEDLEQIV